MALPNKAPELPQQRASHQEEIERWVDALKKGDFQACEHLYAISHQKIFRLCLFLSGDREFAQDLCQDAFLKAFESIHTLRDSKVFSGWLVRITRNLFIDRTRTRPDKRELSGVDLDLVLSEEVERHRAENVLQIQAVTSKLDPDDRAILLLVHLEGHSYKEVGDIMGVSEDHVRSRVHWARKKFIKMYDAA